MRVRGYCLMVTPTRDGRFTSSIVEIRRGEEGLERHGKLQPTIEDAQRLCLRMLRHKEAEQREEEEEDKRRREEDEEWQRRCARHW